MKDFLRKLITPLVHYPEEITIVGVEKNRQLVLEIHVAPEDMGRVIGKGGKRANAIRSIMKAKAATEGRRVMVEIVD
ncbi:MAG TPA: KH domain-containing protein [Clostridiaceae bacterium]|nr:KH domain-containing protein [Clostridiaceae bacterium]